MISDSREECKPVEHKAESTNPAAIAKRLHKATERRIYVSSNVALVPSTKQFGSDETPISITGATRNRSHVASTN